MTDDGKNSPRRPVAVEVPPRDLAPSSLDACGGDPVEERIAALFDKLKAPPEVDLRPLLRVRARLDSVIRPSSEPRSRLWIYAFAGSFLLLSSGAVVAARAWAPHGSGWSSLVARLRLRLEKEGAKEHARKVTRVDDSRVPDQAPAAAPP